MTERSYSVGLFPELGTFHVRSSTYVTPNQVVSHSMAAAVEHVRKIRRVRATPDGWMVRDAFNEYDHQIILHRIGANPPELICTTCPANRKHPCWAVGKVRRSAGFKRFLKTINKGVRPTW